MIKKIIPLGLAILLLITLAPAIKCPYTGAPLPTPYSDVKILPVEKYVGEEITISITDIAEDKTESLPNGRIIIIYYIVDEEVQSEVNKETNKKGIATFKPEDSGRYAVATSARYILFDVLSRCGDNRCSSDEDRISCSKDCATCGDDICDVDETKEECPKDCIICGDNACDNGENRHNCPGDCAACGDDVCDVNENKISCPEDCVVCGDGICDADEMVSLHITTCPIDCNVCGDGYCDEPENKTSCPDDCAPAEELVNGTLLNATNATNTTNLSISVCGDGKCEKDENKSSCAKDCIICGDGFCDKEELESMHQSSCPVDCSVCGDGFCDGGEKNSCEEDCSDSGQGAIIGYFLIPIVLVILIIVFEVMRKGGGAPEKKPKSAGLVRGGKLDRKDKENVDTERLVPFLVMYTALILISSLLLMGLKAVQGPGLAIFDIGLNLLNDSVLIAIIVLLVSVAMAVFSRIVNIVSKAKATEYFIATTLIGMLPGLLAFHNLEYIGLLIGMLAGLVAAIAHQNNQEEELRVLKPFRMGSEAANRVLIVTSVVLAVFVFLNLYLGEDTTDKLSGAIWQSEVTKEIIQDNYGIIQSANDVKHDVVEPLFTSKHGGLDGKLLFSGSVAILLIVILKVFAIVIKLLAGFFAMSFDKTKII